MHPRNSLKFLCSFCVLLLLAAIASNNFVSSLALAQAQTDSNLSLDAQPSAKVTVPNFGLKATSDSPVVTLNGRANHHLYSHSHDRYPVDLSMDIWRQPDP